MTFDVQSVWNGGVLRKIPFVSPHQFGATVMALFIVLVCPAYAQAPPDTPEALLQKVQSAAREIDYAGVFTYQQGSSMESSRVVHLVDGTGERERLEVLDGTPREFLRHNNTVHCLVPDRKLVVVEERQIDRFPGFLLSNADALSDFYSVAVNPEPARVAGRECRIVDVTPRDSHRYGYRLCVDAQTNLLLKAQTLNGDGAVVDQIAFTSVRLGEDVSAEQLNTGWDFRDWKVIEVATTSIDAAAQGWRIANPPGFSLATQVSRPMRSGVPVTQLVLADGLAAISVFIEPYQAFSQTGPSLKQVVHDGAIAIYRTRIGDYWLTAMGEVPAETLRNLAEQTEFVPPAGSPN